MPIWQEVFLSYGSIPLSLLTSAGGEGAEIVYALRNNNTLANLALNNIGEKGQIKRSAYQRVLPENPSKDYYYILRETGNTEPLLIEYGFIDNPNDIRKLNNNLEDYVEGVVKAIADYAGYEYIEPNKESNKEYIVRKGDTLYSISRRFNIPVEELKRINNLTSDVLSIGTTLYLQDSENNSTYIVKRGDTLYKIASIYNTTIDSIKELNNLTSNILTIGQELLIPSSNEPIIPEQTTNYIVQKGDSLWSISKKFNTTVDELIELNNLSTINLQVGDNLLIPKQENINKIYIVEPKDTLWSIAKKNNISVEKLKELNNLTSNLLSIGQELIIA